MISIDDCIGMSGLTRDEIDAIAEHEHIPEAAAAALGAYLMHIRRGEDVVRQMIRDDIRTALARGDRQHAADLLATLRTFLAHHAVS